MRMSNWIMAAVLMGSSWAARADLITIDPNAYAPGQDISTTVPGAILTAVSYVPNTDPNPPLGQAYLPQYSSVFAQSVIPGCTYGTASGLSPCAAGKSNVLSYLPDVTPSSTAILWGNEVAAGGCVSGACDFPVLRVDFTSPTDYVSALLGYFPTGGGLLAAFNDQDQPLGFCVGDALAGFNGPSGSCGSVYPTSQPSQDWGQFSIADASSDISYVLVGGANSYAAIEDVQFKRDVPEPGTLSLFAIGAVGLWLVRRRQLSGAPIQGGA